MIISDLNHLEVVSEETNIAGGSSWYYNRYYNEAFASADSVALGPNTYSATETTVKSVHGLGSSSSSKAVAVSY